ncbi:DUF4258 domain-containing protein [Anaerolineae bacterium CFX7]|nr:DUF4258 domain-containing protein [Anaerolineae bacterium CFX7]
MFQTQHALKRMAQRNLSESDVEYVLTHGCREFRGGVEFRYLRKRDIPRADQTQYARLEGTAIVVGSASDVEDIITVWRNRKHGLRHIRQKSKIHFWRRKARTE